ncbi:hypothetical protein CRE_14473 [Caenorhabditis remanei]|uniref:Uncharacterized protein n=1 Tax=Caenorhabditis remanei TaxID=31234 RepID=E3M940_CAERE|nr:hypothetical protein CRE_14473 [Caenorhabditis remanei]
MKLHSLLLLLIPAITAYGEHTTTIDSHEIHSYVNQLRRQYASKYNVPDMHELIWSNELVEILKPLDWTTSWPEARKTWRYMYFNSSVIPTKDIERQLDLFLLKANQNRNRTLNILLNPLQRFFGCGPKTEGDSKLTVCLMGPRGDFMMFDTSGQSSASPGSKCNKRHRKNNGLCVAENPKKESYYPNPEYFLENVNDLRRVYANRFNVTNMHGLTWNENLVNTAEALDMEAKPWSETQKTWRYVQIKTYDTSSKDIEKEFEFEEEFLLSLSKTGKQRYINKSADSSLGMPELLNPLQRFIGCTHKRRTILCLLGAEGAVTLIDTNLESNAKPGSQCYNNYENVNGLCVPTREEELTIRINQIREKYAKLYNVSNMHQLIWSEDLLKFLELGNFSVDLPQIGKTMRLVYLRKFEFQEYFDFFIESRIENNFISKDPIERNSFFASNVQTSLGDLEFLIPLQKSIACEFVMIKRDYLDFVCLIGPSGKPKMFNVDTASVTTHIAASECSARYKSLDGLCVPEDPRTVSYFGNSFDFLNDVNDARRKYAYKYNISNMHKLKWKESLVTLASSLNCSNNLTCVHKTRRYVSNLVYTGITEKIDEEVDYYLTEMSQDEFLEFLKNGETHHVGHLELLNPLQTSIGCIEKLWDFTVFCLLGDEGSFKMWDLKNVESKAGTNCAPGYENDDGLCSIPEAASIVETTTEETTTEESTTGASTTSSIPEPKAIVETTTEESTTEASTTSSAPKKSIVETTTEETATEETTTKESTTGASTTSSAPSKRRLFPKSSKKHSARVNKKTGGK